MLRLEHFHLRCARHIARMNIHCQANGTWVTPHSDDVLERCGLSRLSDYIAKRKTTLLHHYAFEHSSLYRRCYTSVPTSDRHHLVWWDDAECRALGVPPLMHYPLDGVVNSKLHDSSSFWFVLKHIAKQTVRMCSSLQTTRKTVWKTSFESTPTAESTNAKSTECNDSFLHWQAHLVFRMMKPRKSVRCGKTTMQR